MAHMAAAERDAMRDRWDEAVRRATWTATASPSSSKAPENTDRIRGELV